MGSIELPSDPIPLRRVNVYVSRDTAYNFDKMTQVTKDVLGRLGCGGCHSGRLIDFLIVEDFVVNPKTLEVKELAGGRL